MKTLRREQLGGDLVKWSLTRDIGKYFHDDKTFDCIVLSVYEHCRPGIIYDSLEFVC